MFVRRREKQRRRDHLYRYISIGTYNCTVAVVI